MLKEVAFEVKNICCLGAGYVGGPTMAVIAQNAPEIDVFVVDISEDRIKNWNSKDLKNLPVYEPGLKEIISETRNRNLFFSHDIENCIAAADMIFISVNTPTKVEGFGAGYATDLTWIELSARKIAEFSQGHTIVIEKSTVPVKTADIIKTLLNPQSSSEQNLKSKSFSVLSSPEFLSEGSAIKDLKYPDRILIGGDDKFAIDALKNIYQKWIPSENILISNLWSSELSKLAANACLAQRISSINSLTSLCEKTGAKIDEISRSIGADERIGKQFLKPGPAFGGSCFEKDLLSLIYLCKYYGLNDVAYFWEQVISINHWQRKRVSKLIVEKLFNTVNLKKIVILGFSYKPNTNDTRESASIYICKDLLANGAKLIINDPQVSPSKIENDLKIKQSNDFYNQKGGDWIFCENIEKASEKADAIVILTEWDVYKNINWKAITQKMRKPSWIFDTRLILSEKCLKGSGVQFWQIGKGVI